MSHMLIFAWIICTAQTKGQYEHLTFIQLYITIVRSYNYNLLLLLGELTDFPPATNI